MYLLVDGATHDEGSKGSNSIQDNKQRKSKEEWVRAPYGLLWVVKLEGSGREKKRKWKDEDRRIRGLRALRNLEHCLRYVPRPVLEGILPMYLFMYVYICI